MESLDGPEFHYQCDIREVLDKGWDCLIAFPPCTYLSSSGMHWTTRGLRDPQLTEDALAFVKLLMDAPIPFIAIENPIGCISSRIRKPDVVVHPWWFGDDASKSTCLWLKRLPLLMPTKIVEPRLVEYPKGSGKMKKRWGNQLASGHDKFSPSEDRPIKRALTFPGVAEQMAAQWSPVLEAYSRE